MQKYQEKEINILRQLTKVYPMEPRWTRELARMLHKYKYYQKAIEQHFAVMKLNSVGDAGKAHCYSIIGNCFEKLGHVITAKRYFKQAISYYDK